MLEKIVSFLCCCFPMLTSATTKSRRTTRTVSYRKSRNNDPAWWHDHNRCALTILSLSNCWTDLFLLVQLHRFVLVFSRRVLQQRTIPLRLRILPTARSSPRRVMVIHLSQFRRLLSIHLSPRRVIHHAHPPFENWSKPNNAMSMTCRLLLRTSFNRWNTCACWRTTKSSSYLSIGRI